MFSGRRGAARLSIIVVVSLIVLKVVVGIITGSLSIFAQAVDSFLDLFAVVITFMAIRVAEQPADEKHPFGHGKAENVAAIIQAVLIIIAGGSIYYSAISRIITGATVEMTEAGIGVMAVSVIASILLSRHLLKVARQEDSQALEANAEFLKAHPSFEVRLDGHCDDMGTAAYNLGLGQRRAASVRSYLQNLTAVDYAIKTGQTTPRVALERLVIEMASK